MEKSSDMTAMMRLVLSLLGSLYDKHSGSLLVETGDFRRQWNDDAPMRIGWPGDNADPEHWHNVPVKEDHPAMIDLVSIIHVLNAAVDETQE